MHKGERTRTTRDARPEPCHAEHTVETTIVGFHQDADGDWIAELACGHGQHMRHRPPWTLREWVVTQEGRAEKLGVAIDCPLCDRIATPNGASE